MTLASRLALPALLLACGGCFMMAPSTHVRVPAGPSALDCARESLRRIGYQVPAGEAAAFRAARTVDADTWFAHHYVVTVQVRPDHPAALLVRGEVVEEKFGPVVGGVPTGYRRRVDPDAALAGELREVALRCGAGTSMARR